MQIRRVVTGFDSDARPVVSHEGPAPASLQLPPEVGAELLDIWRSDSIPLDTTGSEDPTAGEFELMPTGSLFRIIEFAPGDHQPMWHTTATVDFIYIASGEITLLHGPDPDDPEEVTLVEGDTAVQRGVPHAWVNKGDTVCRMVNASVPAALPDGVEPG